MLGEDQPQLARTARRATRSPRGCGAPARSCSGGMTTFQACSPPGCRVSGTTMRPLRLPRREPDAGVADLRCADQLVQRHLVAWAIGSSSSRLGLRWPVSSRDRVLFEIPVAAASSVRVTPRRARTPRGAGRPRPGRRRSPMSCSIRAVHYHRSRKQQRMLSDCEPRGERPLQEVIAMETNRSMTWWWSAAARPA